VLLDTRNAIFQALGTNDRTCASCHEAEDGFSISAASVQKRFERSRGFDAVFRPVDGATNPGADVSTLEARRSAYSYDTIDHIGLTDGEKADLVAFLSAL
jgi:hypothetical protein